MQILEELIELAARETAQSDLLRSAAEAIRRDLEADVCRIYLQRYKGPLTLRASVPEPLEIAEEVVERGRPVLRPELLPGQPHRLDHMPSEDAEADELPAVLLAQLEQERRDDRAILNGILWILRTGAP